MWVSSTSPPNLSLIASLTMEIYYQTGHTYRQTHTETESDTLPVLLIEASKNLTRKQSSITDFDLILECSLSLKEKQICTCTFFTILQFYNSTLYGIWGEYQFQSVHVCVCVCVFPMELKLGGQIDYSHTSILQEIHNDWARIAQFMSHLYFKS